MLEGVSTVSIFRKKVKDEGLFVTLRKGIRYLLNYTKFQEEKILTHLHLKVNSYDYVEKAITWINNHYVRNGGIIISSRRTISYSEVTGYLIPTLYQWGEKRLVRNLIKWLIYKQNRDGSFSAPDGVPYTFDTGQVVRGFVSVVDDFPEVKEPLKKACDWIIKQIQSDGRLSTPSTKMWGKVTDDRIHLYVIPPLIKTGKKLHNPKYIKSAYHVIQYYKAKDNIIEFNTLSHFYGYIIEALYDLGEHDLARKAANNIAQIQKKDGSIPAYKNVSWVCIPGVAQFAVIFYKLGMISNGDKALNFLEKIQNRTGGFYGSTGQRANYFPYEEISWATKFFLDAYYWQIKSSFNSDFKIFPETINSNDKRIQTIISFFGNLNRKKIIDVGCGKGRFIKKLQNMFPGAQFYGIDISEKMLYSCPKNAKVSIGSILNIPYPDNFFDFIYSIETLEHSVRIEKAIEEMSRVLKPGGKILIIDKDISEMGKLKTQKWEQWFSPEQLLSLFNKYMIRADYKVIPYSKDSKLHHLFIAWEGQKYE